MPIYMDSHIVPGVEAKHVAEAHKKDLGIQDQFGCRNMTYWVDEDRGRVFCLIDAPNEQAVRDMHNYSHGLVPHEIIQVNSKVVEAFLGRISDPETFSDSDSSELKIFNDPAFRVLLAIEIKSKGLLIHELGEEKSKTLLDLFFDKVKHNVLRYEGNEVKGKEDVIIVSFASVSMGVDCAQAIQTELHVAAELIDLRMGIHAGLPVDSSKKLFGKAVNLAQYLCTLRGEARIVISSLVSKLNQVHLDNPSLYGSKIRNLSASEERTLESLAEILEQKGQDPDLGIKGLCSALGMSKSQLYRKCKCIIGTSPNTLLREYRLQKSLELLGLRDCNVSQASYQAGFNSPSYFIKCFHQRFGLLPLSYSKTQT